MNELPIDILVNKKNLLPRNYCPKNLVVTDQNENNFHKYKDPNLKPMVRADIYPYIQLMINDAKRDGVEFIIDSGYRSYNYQQVLLDNLIKEKGAEAYTLIALPGSSEHQTGLAIDIAYYHNGVYDDNVKGEDKEAIWLANNSYKYGFILRYPKDKENITGFQYEPWHFRFVGLKLAEKLYKTNMTLDEYYSKKEKGILKRS